MDYLRIATPGFAGFNLGLELIKAKNVQVLKG